jgi:pyruvate,orthophosphate dikinase
VEKKMPNKYVYFFGAGKADGNESMKNLLGGKGANLAEMAGHKDLRLPVPPGFTITTEVCTYYYDHKKTYPKELKAQVAAALARSWARSSATSRIRCWSRCDRARAARCPA